MTGNILNFSSPPSVLHTLLVPLPNCSHSGSRPSPVEKIKKSVRIRPTCVYSLVRCLSFNTPIGRAWSRLCMHTSCCLLSLWQLLVSLAISFLNIPPALALTSLPLHIWPPSLGAPDSSLRVCTSRGHFLLCCLGCSAFSSLDLHYTGAFFDSLDMLLIIATGRLSSSYPYTCSLAVSQSRVSQRRLTRTNFLV